MAAWRSRFHATVASDVRLRDGLGWEFADMPSGDVVWTVSREDGGAFPVFCAARAQGMLPTPGDLEAMTAEAVSDLVSTAGIADPVGWISRNIAAGLLFASCDVLTWKGEEWALGTGGLDALIAWATPGDPRVPYAWLRARCRGSERLISIYQDDALFGLSFLSPVDHRLPASDSGSLRSRARIGLGMVHPLGRSSRHDLTNTSTEPGQNQSGEAGQAPSAASRW